MCKDIGRLYRHYETLGAVFDDNLPFTGLWTAFMLGILPRILRLKCDEVNR